MYMIPHVIPWGGSGGWGGGGGSKVLTEIKSCFDLLGADTVKMLILVLVHLNMEIYNVVLCVKSHMSS